MNLLRKYYDKESTGGEIPDEVRSKIDQLCNLNQEPLYREGVFDGLNLASEEISRLKEENERLRGDEAKMRNKINQLINDIEEEGQRYPRMYTIDVIRMLTHLNSIPPSPTTKK